MMAWNGYEKMLMFFSFLSSELRHRDDRREAEALHAENQRMRSELEASRRKRELDGEQRAALIAAGLDIREYETPQAFFDRLSAESKIILEEKERILPMMDYDHDRWLERIRELDARWEALDKQKSVYLNTLYPDLNLPG